MTVSIDRLCFRYTEKPLITRLSLELGKENPVFILGPSGCGKTTLLHLIAGLLKPQSGSIYFEGINLSPGESPVSFVFQEPRLLPWLTVLENVMLPVKNITGKKDAESRALRFLELSGLSGREDAFPHELSGGQRQRVSLARGFTYPAPLLLMDEPFQSLDIPLRLELLGLTGTLLQKERRLLIAVTHDPREALSLAGRVIVLGGEGLGPVFDMEGDRLKRYGRAELEEELLRVLAACCSGGWRGI
ncbi:MAG: ABC transporter ATP-binding protein [Treponema sp.]|nr:ABC transporter ATP-binding protein [Treponema sp.]